MKKAESKFSAWFEVQCGKRVGRYLGKVPDNVLFDRIQSGRTAAEELKERHQWDAKREAALYAWSIKDTDK